MLVCTFRARQNYCCCRNTLWGASHKCCADYHLDLKHIKSYVESAATPEAWEAYQATYLSGTQADYVNAVGGADAIGAIAKPVY